MPVCDHSPNMGQAERVGGIRYTIKDGIVYDVRQLAFLAGHGIR